MNKIIRIFTIRTFTTSIKKLKENSELNKDKELIRIVNELNQNAFEISKSINFLTFMISIGFFGITVSLVGKK